MRNVIVRAGADHDHDRVAWLFPSPSGTMAAGLMIDTFGKSGVCEFLIATHM
jgi:hypothetical protein